MGILTETGLDRAASTAVTPVVAHYTICPVLVASGVANELGWVAEEFRRVGASLSYLRSTPDEHGWLEHYNHQSPNLFRDGGNSPAIQAKADIRDTVLLGLTQAQPAGKIIARADAPIYSVAQLRGKRIGLYQSAITEKIDFRRATSEHGIHVALALHGLSEKDVEIVSITAPDVHVAEPSSGPSETWGRQRDKAARGVELQALERGEIDAYYEYGIGLSDTLEQSGKFKVLEDLDRYPDWTLRIANAPRTLTVSAEFAKAHRDVVVAWLRAAIRAGRWINANPQAAAAVFARTTFYPEAAVAKLLPSYDLVPNLSAQSLAGLRLSKDFLREHGYVKNDFDVNTWADSSYLEEALASLPS
ncbi:ABC transporter substrate-binding protein [Uliginosibacterium aquaticum]|uniref:ABC transporter substrate-binding protein n=1 Tax=Uliginosibacterium aquaticum TaxID=2731212 RepID=A0ABX2IEH6_9RHOO|nr:ABC transporter substrate-binding protein [Uliginosibacterium aquaticum]NSL55066.1 ABC transporter substrate-binding protein [Uliginosibacterium aquaticum]